MDFFIGWAVVLGLVAVPALVNYYVNRYFTLAGTLLAPTAELLLASVALAFAVLVTAMLITVGVSLAYEDLKEEISAFTQLGLAGYGQERPIALSGVLSAVSIGHMALLGLLGVARVPSRFVR